MYRISLISACALLGACAATQPVLYPNAFYDLGGADDADATIDECMNAARAHGSHDPVGEVVTSTAGGAVVGAVVGAALGSVFGEAKRGAQVGSAQGAAEGFIYGLAHASRPNYTTQNFVSRCLAERGYEVIGWE